MADDTPAWAQRSRFRLDRADPYLSLGHVTVFVRDHEASLHFYVDQLGFSLMYDVALPNGLRFVAVAPPDGTALLALIVPLPGTPEYDLIGRSQGIVFLTEDVPAKYEQWRARGVSFAAPPTQPEWGGVLTELRDVDGNAFALVGFDDMTREVEKQRQVTEQRAEAQRRATRELEIAREVQARLFPQLAPSITTLEYAGSCVQARKVGGDYYDFLDLGDGRFGFVVGDVSGKGIAAALLMANLQANLRSQCAIAARDLPRVMRAVNRLFFDNTPDSAYATLFFGEYDDRSRRLSYLNCGHLAGLVLRADGSLERLPSTATVLGLFPQWDASIAECALGPGDTLALYTDGITESTNGGGEEFGEEGLADALRRHRGQGPGDMQEGVLEAVRRFSPQEQQDDRTLIIAKCR
jgi:serine phosphatase RsbU (regulator of sigma subunit)/catechol 2,3-dioxygenase-like lactoylglutathione lyase family enzyme